MEEIKRGLTQEEVVKSREKHGENRLSAYKKKSFFKCFISNLGDPIIKILIGALIINIIFMFPNINWFESGGILFSIVIATLVSTVSEYSSENTFEKLREKSQNQRAVVKRAEGVVEIKQEEIVVGDILILSAGESVFADSVVIKGNIFVNESALTGESREVSKKEGDKVLKGSLVLMGSCEAEAQTVGENTYYGRVAKELRSETRPSPLKKRLSQLAKSISKLGYIASILIAFSYLFNVFVIDAGFQSDEILLRLKDVRFLFSKLLYALTLAVSIIVVAVPEGLPMMITVVLSSNMKNMMKDNVLVKKLVGIETSGNISLLFTDKTGTLTEGKLKVKEIHTLFDSYTSLSSLRRCPEFEKYLTLCACYCNDARMNGVKAIGSDATDRSILEYFSSKKPRAEIKERVPFDSGKKYSAASVEINGKEIALFKGAPEKLLGVSEFYLTEMGEKRILKGEEIGKLHQKMKDLANNSYRVVAMAIKEGVDTSLGGLTFIGLIALRDKVRHGALQAINQVTKAGVGVVMITGDNPHTAEAIAKECGIISPLTKRKEVITGEMMEKMNDEEIKNLLPQIAVIARALPSDKSRLVKIAQSCGYVVGMTGDGINDAPSLKLADVGFGMGDGTDVAKEACDIVISDNNFASIVKAILYGRTIFNSIRSFIVFQLAMNFSAVGISLIGPFIGIDNPVTVTQMLWINIIMDTLGALAFAKEPHLNDYMKCPPLPLTEKIISKNMIKKISSTAIYVLLMCVWFLKSDTLPMILTRGDEKYILSAFFAMFIFTGVFVCFISRTDRINIVSNLNKNRSFMVIMLLISVMQMAFIYFGGDTFRATPLAPWDLIKVILISFTVVIFDFIRKIASLFGLMSRRAHKSEKAMNCQLKINLEGDKNNVIK